jgi:hypothetical protein
MANLALAFAFLISLSRLTHGKQFFPTQLNQFSQNLDLYQYFLVLVLSNIWIPAVVIYVVLRLAHVERWLPRSRTAQFLLGLGNLLLISFGCCFLWAATAAKPAVVGVIYLGFMYLILPAVAILIAALLLLCILSIKERQHRQPIRWLDRRDGIRIGLALAMPISAVVWILFAGKHAPFQEWMEAREVYKARCQEAGERIIESAADVESIYLDPDSGDSFTRDGEGRYHGGSIGILGQQLVNDGMLLFFEEKNKQRQVGSKETYLRHISGDWEGEAVDSVASPYGVFQRRLTTEDDEKRLQIRGREVTVTNLKTGAVAARLAYYTNALGEICGPAGGKSPSTTDFIGRALNLTPRFPIWPRQFTKTE